MSNCEEMGGRNQERRKERMKAKLINGWLDRWIAIQSWKTVYFQTFVGSAGAPHWKNARRGDEGQAKSHE